MDSETRIRQALSILSKDPEKRYVERSPIRNRQLHFLENLDWYYIPPTQTFRRRVYEYASFDSDGVPTQDADGNKLYVYVMEELHKVKDREKKVVRDVGKTGTAIYIY